MERAGDGARDGAEGSPTREAACSWPHLWDGIDACVVEITDEQQADSATHQGLKIRLIGFLTHPYPDALKEDLHGLCAAGSTADVCMYNVLLGKMFARAAHLVVDKCGLKMEDVAVIGSHGQTIHHLPSPRQLHGFSITSTLQIGDPSVIAQECGVTTVGDFRMADMAVGGQGAPLVPYLDRMLLESHYTKTRRLGMFLNIGGISNISAFIPSSRSTSEEERFLGFDCGPGNVLLDSLVKRWFNEDFDKGGQKAAIGEVSLHLLERLMEDRYINTPPPKSTGREHYNAEYVNSIASLSEEMNISKEDCLATVTEFTAAAVLTNFELFIRPLISDRKSQDVDGLDLFVSGGGARNETLMRALCWKFEKHKVTVKTTDVLGIDSDAKEAVCFALLAYQTINGRSTNVPGVTGARKDVILGKICPITKTENLTVS